MIRWLAALAIAGLLIGPAHPLVLAPTSGAVCSQAATFLARAPLESPAALTNLICGLVTDGVITGDLSTTGCGSKLDVFRVYAMANSTDARLNICKNAFNAITGGGGLPTFTTNVGFTGQDSSSTVYLDSNYAPGTAGGNCTSAGCSLGVWQLSSAAAYDDLSVTQSGVGVSKVVPRAFDDTFKCGVNANNESAGPANTNGSGFYVCSWAPSTLTFYKNATSVGTVSVAFLGAPTINFFELAQNVNGVATGSGAQLSSIFIGAALSSGDVTALKNRLCTYLIAVGAVGSC